MSNLKNFISFLRDEFVVYVISFVSKTNKTISMLQKTERARGVILLVALLCMVVPLSAAEQITSMRDVREMAKQTHGMVVEQDIAIEGYVISKPHGHNNDLNIQLHYASLKNDDLATVYIESLSGDIGFRIKLSSRVAKTYPRYARVVLSLKGTTLKYAEPSSVTVEGVSEANILRLTQCTESDLPRKEKYISEMTDDDMYTYITLKDCEIVFKDGSYSNVYERYVQRTAFNKKVKPNKSMDCWATLICDKNGASIYALTNTLCPWRRDGAGVPQGVGVMKGIVSSVSLPRYGGDVFGRYIIFPVDGEDFDMDWAAATSMYRSIAEWNWSDNKRAFSTEYGDMNAITTERVVADIGRGMLQVTASSESIRGRDTNNTRVDAGKEEGTKGFGGFVRYGALSVKTAAHNWWDWKSDCGKGVEIEFSTAGLSGERLLFGFTFAAGEISAATSYGFPIYWNVEYSTDGKEWHTVEGSKPKKMRSLPWHWSQEVNGIHYDSILAGAGYTEHIVMLPKSLFGESKVYVRVIPVAKICATLGYDYVENGALRRNSTVETVVNFGSFVVRYN